MNKQKKQELFPFLIMFKLNEQVGDGKKLQDRSEQEIDKLIGLASQVKENPQLFDEMVSSAVSFSDQEWSALEQEFVNYSTAKSTTPASDVPDNTASEEMEDESLMAKKGAKLKHLQELKKGTKMKKEKCSCGCELVSKKEAGGTISKTCGCGCKMKKEEGGKISDKVKAISDKKLPKIIKKK